MSVLAVTHREVALMQVAELIQKVERGEILACLAAERLDMDVRVLRRHRARYRADGVVGLRDRRVGRAPANRAHEDEENAVVELYKNKFNGFSVAHFIDELRREYGGPRSDTWYRNTLRKHGVGPSVGPDRHRRRRERRDHLGELVHLDGTRIGWEGLAGPRPMLIVIMDDATGQVLYAQMDREETSLAVLAALDGMLRKHGIPREFQTDRAGWAFNPHGRRLGQDVPTQVGRVLSVLQIKHFPGCSPQGRGRSERMNRTIKARLIPELEAAGIATMEDANVFIRTRFLPKFNARFGRTPASPESFFLRAPLQLLPELLAVSEERKVANDNTVSWRGNWFQISKQPGLTSCAGETALVKQYLDSTIGIWLDADHCVGRYHPNGRPLPTASENVPQAAAA